MEIWRWMVNGAGEEVKTNMRKNVFGKDGWEV